MIPLVEIPEIVRHFAPHFESVFSQEAFQQFQRYVSGLIMSQNKTVEGINRIFVVDVRNQSSLNRLLTESPFSVSALNRARLDMLFSLPGTAFKRKGVLSLDDTLLSHYGHHFEKIAKLFDPVSRSYVWAHNLVNLHYSDDVTDYPIAFRLWEPAEADTLERGLKAAGIRLREGKYVLKKRDPRKWRTYLMGVWQRHQKKEEVQQIYQSKLIIGQTLLRHFFSNHPHSRLPVTFDNWYTQPFFCKFLHEELKLSYLPVRRTQTGVGTLTGEDQVNLAKGDQRLTDFDAHLQEEHHQALSDGEKPVFHKITISYKGEKETYYSYCNTHRIQNFGKHRLVINHQEPDLSDSPCYFLSNRLKWQATNITRIRRHRWPVEVYHEEGKADGLDQYQVRDFEAIGKHIALVAVTYSLLRAAQHDKSLIRKLHQNVQKNLGHSAGSCLPAPDARQAGRRNTQAQALWALATFIQAALFQGQTLDEVMQPLLATVSY